MEEMAAAAVVAAESPAAAAFLRIRGLMLSFPMSTLPLAALMGESVEMQEHRPYQEEVAAAAGVSPGELEERHLMHRAVEVEAGYWEEVTEERVLQGVAEAMEEMEAMELAAAAVGVMVSAVLDQGDLQGEELEDPIMWARSMEPAMEALEEEANGTQITRGNGGPSGGGGGGGGSSNFPVPGGNGGFGGGGGGGNGLSGTGGNGGYGGGGGGAGGPVSGRWVRGRREETEAQANLWPVSIMAAAAAAVLGSVGPSVS